MGFGVFKSKNPGNTAKKVLVIKLSALGDFVLSLGACRVVREAHPNAEITLLTTPPYEEFATLCPYFDRVETDGRPGGMRDSSRLVSRIRKQKYDIIYDFQTSGRTANYFKALGGYFGRAPLWSGHARGSAFCHSGEERERQHSIERLASQLEIAGLAPEGGWTPATLPIPRLDWVRTKLGDPPSLSPEFFGLKSPYMLLIPGASAHREAKRWPEKYYAQLSTQLIEQGVDVAIIGAKAESELARTILKHEPRVKNLVTRTSLFQIIGLAERAAFVVGNDTGPMHMATLTGTPGVALFATDESNPEKASPRGGAVIVVSAPKLSHVLVDDVVRAVRNLGVLSSN